eukprot:108756-Prorocentrum_minimum.AAC.2
MQSYVCGSSFTALRWRSLHAAPVRRFSRTAALVRVVAETGEGVQITYTVKENETLFTISRLLLVPPCRDELARRSDHIACWPKSGATPPSSLTPSRMPETNLVKGKLNTSLQNTSLQNTSLQNTSLPSTS